MRQRDECGNIEVNDLELSFDIKLCKVAGRSETCIVDQPVDLETVLLRLFKEGRVRLKIK